MRTGEYFHISHAELRIYFFQIRGFCEKTNQDSFRESYCVRVEFDQVFYQVQKAINLILFRVAFISPCRSAPLNGTKLSVDFSRHLYSTAHNVNTVVSLIMGKFEYTMHDKLGMLYADDDHLCVTESSTRTTERAVRCDRFCQLPFGDTIMNFLRIFPSAGSVPCASFVFFYEFCRSREGPLKLFFLACWSVI